MAHSQHVVGDAGAGGEEDRGAVRGGVGRVRGVRPFDVAGCVEGLVRAGEGAVVEFACHALARGDDQRYICGFGVGEVGV